MSLDRAIDYALENNVDIRNARLNVLDAEQQVKERLSGGLPQVNGELNYQRYLKVPVQPLPDAFVQFLEQINPNGEVEREASFVLRNNFTAGADLDAMVFDATFFLGVRAARAFKDYTARELLTKKREVRNSVIDAYLPVLLLDKNLEIIRKNITNLEKLLFETRELYKAGFAEQLDLDRQQLSLANLQTELENLQRERQTAIAALKYLLGLPAGQQLVLDEDLEQLAEGTSVDPATELAPANRPEIRLLEQSITLNEIQVKANRMAYLPSLRAYGAYQYAYQGNNSEDGFWAPTSLLGLRLSVPIFDGFYKKTQIERAKISLEKNRNLERDLKRAIRLEVETARSNYFNTRKRLESQRQNLDLAERIYETTQIKYREGVGTSVEITQAEQSLYSAQSNYLQALYDLLQAKMDLKMALGGTVK